MPQAGGLWQGERSTADAAIRYGSSMRCLRPTVLSLLLATTSLVGSCDRAPPLMVWVDGFAPENVSFEVKDLGPLDDAGITAVKRQGSIDGVMRLPPGTCSGPCRVASLSVYVVNRGPQPEGPPVVRLDVPEGQPRRLPIAFGGKQIDPGRTGRVRWLVELHPGEERLTATVSSSITFDTTTTPMPAPTPPMPTTTPTPTTPTP